MDIAGAKALALRSPDFFRHIWHVCAEHPWICATGLVLAVLVWKHFKGDYGPQTWSLSKERPKALRWLVHVLVMPMRLLASLFSGSVALAVLAVIAFFVYAIWKIAHG